MAKRVKSKAKLPPGVKLLHTLEGHNGTVNCVVFDPRSGTLASGSNDATVKLWDARSGGLVRTLEGHRGSAYSVAFDPLGKTLASGSADKTVKLWDVRSGNYMRTFEGHGGVGCLAFDLQGKTLASGSDDNTVRLWDARSGKLLRTLEGHKDLVWSVAFDPQGKSLASGSGDYTPRLLDPTSGKLLHTLKGHQGGVRSVRFDPTGRILASAGGTAVKLWDPASGKLLRALEGHTDLIEALGFLHAGRLLASKGQDNQVRIWSCTDWNQIATFPEPSPDGWICPLACHPDLPLIATLFADRKRIHIWELDFEILLGRQASLAATAAAVHHTTAKIVLVGDHSVGKSALGYRLIHERFEKQESTHGQQFWVYPALGRRRADGTDCEAILWDFAGQPDYRLVHALFVDNADLALVLFDASDLRDPLHGVDF